jgi:hypothetical protein
MRITRIIAVTLSWTAAATLHGCSGDGPRANKSVSPRSDVSGIRLTTLVYDIRDPLSERCDDPTAEVNRLLNSLTQKGEAPSEFTRDAWKADGVRLIAAPMDQVGALLKRFRACRPVQQINFTELLTPAPIYSGPLTDQDIRLKREDEVLTLPGGMLRLFARCYEVPGELNEQGIASAAIRLDVSLQHADPSLLITTNANPFAPAPSARPVEQGGFFRTLDFSIDLDASATLVLFDQSPEQSQSPIDVAGPIPLMLPTVGQVLLTDFETIPKPVLRTIIVIEAVTPRASTLR